MRRKSQAALEFLSTYVWAFMILTATLGALYYFGVFDFGKYLPQKCIFPSQFKCIDFALKASQVNIKLINGIGEDIEVSFLNVSNDAVVSVMCTSPLPFNWTHGTERNLFFTSCSGGGYLPQERVDLKVMMIYSALNTPSRPKHQINGKINARVTN